MSRTVIAKPTSRGFSLIEAMIAMFILMIGLLGLAAMFPAGFVAVTGAGKMTMAVTGSRQILEDARSVPFTNLINMNGFDTNDASTLPAAQPERDIARRWRYALAGEGSGFTFTTTEKSQWRTLATTVGSLNATLGARGRISVVAQSATLRLVTITINVPGRTTPVSVATLFSRT